MLLVRRFHSYVGLFIAPSVLLFCVSGACQLFKLHENHGSYHAPALIETLGNLHKDQVLSEADHVRGPPAATVASDRDAHAGPPGHDDHDDEAQKGPTLVLKWFFEAITAGLAISTLFGLWIGLCFTRTPRLSWGLLIAGVVVPVLIILL